jgi:hypothetical protein
VIGRPVPTCCHRSGSLTMELLISFGMKLITVLNYLHKNYELGVACSSRHNVSRFQTLDYQPPTRRPSFPALALIACLVLGSVVTPASTVGPQQPGRDTPRSVDILSGRMSSSIFVQARPNKLQTNVSFNKKRVGAVTAGRVATLGLRETWLRFSAPPLGFLRRDFSMGSGRSPPALST